MLAGVMDYRESTNVKNEFMDGKIGHEVPCASDYEPDDGSHPRPSCSTITFIASIHAG